MLCMTARRATPRGGGTRHGLPATRLSPAQPLARPSDARPPCRGRARALGAQSPAPPARRMTSSYSQKITEAVLARAQPRSKGISIASIKGFHTEMTWNPTAFKKALDKLLESEELTRTKNSFKLSPAARKVAIKQFGEPNFDDASPTARKVRASPRPRHATEAEPSSLLSLPGGAGRRDARGACARGAA